MIFSTDQLDEIHHALGLQDAPEFLTGAEHKRLMQMIGSEIARRDRMAAEQAVQPGARPVQYATGGAIITRYETPAAAHGVKAPKKGPDGSGVKIDDIDALLMLVGDASDLIPEA